MPYCSYGHFDRFIEGFGTLYYGTQAGGTGTVQIDTVGWLSDITSAFNRINISLDAINRIPNVPVGTESSGSYNQALIDWNCYETIYTKLRARHFIDYNGQVPEWIQEFGSRAKSIEDGIINGIIPLETDTTNQGIGYPVRVYGSSVSYFYSNYDTGFYYPSDYERTYHFRVVDVSNGTNIGQAQFYVSKDDGYSFGSTPVTTGTDWIGIEGGLEVRWGFNPNAGTSAQLAIGDTWKVKCTPVNKASVGQSSRYGRIPRG